MNQYFLYRKTLFTFYLKEKKETSKKGKKEESPNQDLDIESEEDSKPAVKISI